MLSIIIGGDIVPPSDRLADFNSGTLIDEKVINYLEEADVRIFNLETPLTKRNTPIVKQGKSFRNAPEAVLGLKHLKVDVVSLANNHVLDQGEYGLLDTINALENAEIRHVGAGRNIEVATKSCLIEQNGMIIGIYACTEHEFSIATDTSAGANPYDPMESFDHIAELKRKCDKVIVLYHGGYEYYPYPSPLLQKTCRKMVDKGADLVVCQHSHCVGCAEEYKGAAIVYGQGDFLSSHFAAERENTGLLVKVNCVSGELLYLPICQRDGCVMLAQGEAKDYILQQFGHRSAQIMEIGFIEKQFRNFAQSKQNYYFYALAGFGKWMRRIDRWLFSGRLSKGRYNAAKRLAIRNYIECEAHWELMLENLKE